MAWENQRQHKRKGLLKWRKPAWQEGGQHSEKSIWRGLQQLKASGEMVSYNQSYGRREMKRQAVDVELCQVHNGKMVQVLQPREQQYQVCTFQRVVLSSIRVDDRLEGGDAREKETSCWPVEERESPEAKKLAKPRALPSNTPVPPKAYDSPPRDNPERT